MNIITAERIAAAAAEKPAAIRHAAWLWAKSKGRDRNVPADFRARAEAVARTLFADMGERDRRADLPQPVAPLDGGAFVLPKSGLRLRSARPGHLLFVGRPLAVSPPPIDPGPQLGA